MIFNILFIGTLIGLLWTAMKYLTNSQVYISDKKRHSWKSVKYLNGKNCYCNLCEMSLQSFGVFCDRCGICADMTSCIKLADKKLKCKEQRTKDPEVNVTNFQHNWIRGNLKNNAVCDFCKEEIDYHGEPGVCGRRCCWCLRSVHDDCFKKGTFDVCDFGIFKNFIIPPFAIKTSRTRDAPKLHLSEITPIPQWPDWKPLLVVANVKSGSSNANEIVSLFRGILNPLQIIELSAFFTPKEALQWARKLSPIGCRILVAGGDGTVAWILNNILELKIEPQPEVCIIPTGTGNDLSRVLGWGSDAENITEAFSILEKIQNSQQVKIDRWLLELTPDNTNVSKLSRHFQHTKKIYMYNYFSVGVDALVTLNFHKARDSAFYIYSSRVINKFLYLLYGTHQVMIQDCVNLEKNIDVYLDDVKLELPELQSVVVLNIDSWGAGVNLCKMDKSADIQSFSDGLVDVFGVVSSFHIAQLQIGLSTPIKLGQAKKVRIVLKTTQPVQTDGEPFHQAPGEIVITKHSQACLLQSPDVTQ